LRAAHEEALLDDLAVLHRVKADFIEVQAILALGVTSILKRTTN
jgi:hypothetical protein